VELFPAIDLRAGRVVRLSQGAADRETSYHHDPVAQAEAFANAGARWIHVVDLDRAFGRGDNQAVVAAIARAVAGRVRVQVGGGLRTLGALETVLALGAARGVLGTAAVTDPGLVAKAAEQVGAEHFAVGLDTKGGRVAIRGWMETTPVMAEELARRVIADGAGTLIHTDITRDGMLSGPDVGGATALQALGAEVIVSGGVASLEDLREVREAGLAGAIVGRALYEGKFSLREALDAVA
jgi:phosphoribosylformimino-5-aminoimidazole carboxamide ribotide isomerase